MRHATTQRRSKPHLPITIIIILTVVYNGGLVVGVTME